MHVMAIHGSWISLEHKNGYIRFVFVFMVHGMFLSFGSDWERQGITG
jgi:hypothetical protein